MGLACFGYRDEKVGIFLTDMFVSDMTKEMFRFLFSAQVHESPVLVTFKQGNK